HGSIEWLQCTRKCGVGLFAADPAETIAIDENTMRGGDALPACPSCGELARPNVLMFGAWQWDARRTEEQHAGLETWMACGSGDRLVSVECGAGKAVPTVRHFCERVSQVFVAPLIRINRHEPEAPGNIGIASGALETLRALDACIEREGNGESPRRVGD